MKILNKILCFLGFHDNEDMTTTKLDNFGSYEIRSICKKCHKTTIEVVRYAPTGDVTTFRFTR